MALLLWIIAVAECSGDGLVTGHHFEGGVDALIGVDQFGEDLGDIAARNLASVVSAGDRDGACRVVVGQLAGANNGVRAT